MPQQSPETLKFTGPDPDAGELPFHVALRAFIDALGWTEYQAADLFASAGLGRTRNTAVNRWKMGPKSHSGVVPRPAKQRAVMRLLAKAWREHEYNRVRRERRAKVSAS